MKSITRIPKILIADDDRQMSRRLADFLKERGFACKTVSEGFNALEVINEWKPNFIICDMMLPKLNALSILERIHKRDFHLDKKTVFMVTSGHNIASNVKAALQAGATDFIVKPAPFKELLSRIVFHTQKKKEIKEVTHNDNPSERSDYFLYLSELTLRKIATQDYNQDAILFDLVQMLALATGSARCSIIKTNMKNMFGTVIKSSDNKDFSNFNIQLRKYPEITTVLHTKKLVAIEDLSSNITMAKIKEEFKSISFNSMIVCPVWAGNEIYGVISARIEEESGSKMFDADIRFSQIVAHLAGMHFLQSSALLQKAA